MNHLTLTQLIHQLGGTEKVTGFFLVLARVTPLFIVAPLFSSRMVSLRVRGVVAVGLAMGMTSVALHGQHIPGAPMQVVGLLVDQLLVGLAFAYAVSVVFAAIQAVARAAIAWRSSSVRWRARGAPSAWGVWSVRRP